MEWFSQYVRNIAVFLIFISFLGIILPTDHYKKYINLVMGLVLILIILAPIGRIFVGSDIKINRMLSDMEIELNKNIIDKEKDYYEQVKMDSVIAAYKESLQNQMEQMVYNKGFSVLSSEIVVEEEGEQFGAIKKITLHIRKMDDEKKPNTSLIKINRVEIGPAISHLSEGEEKEQIKSEHEDIKNLKSFLSDFYNLSVDNIYIIVQDN